MLWMFITLAPVLNARWMAANVFTERYLYLPSVGFCWVIAWSWVELWQLLQRHAAVWRWACVLASFVILSLAFVRIVTRNRDWRTEEVLFARTLAAAPDAYPIRTNLGVAFWERGDVKSAEREWLTMLKANSNDAVVLNDLGLVALKEKRYTEATDFLRRSMRVKPNYTESHLNLGSAYLEMGETDWAELQFRAAVALSPLNARAHDELGRILMGAGRLQEAEKQFRQSVESTPNVTGYDALGDIYRRWDEPKLAERAYREALSLDEFDSHAHFNLGSLYAAAGHTAEAVREYQAGLVTDPANSEALAALKKLAP
jgi:tetratricopeptide (TPR) repeat protein